MLDGLFVAAQVERNYALGALGFATGSSPLPLASSEGLGITSSSATVRSGSRSNRRQRHMTGDLRNAEGNIKRTIGQIKGGSWL